jgi:hypothetical protein
MSTERHAAEAEMIEVVQQQVAARCPPESKIDVIFRSFNGRHDHAPIIAASCSCKAYLLYPLLVYCRV